MLYYMGMDKSDIAGLLQEIAVLLELKGENPFKIRAYDNGARVLNNLQEDLDSLIAGERLDKVSGIGKALAEKISILREKGSLPFYDNLKASVPPGLLQMLEIPGFGPKKIRKVRDALGIESIAALKEACLSGAIAGLPGFGEKSQQKLLQGIANREAYGKRHLWWNAYTVAEPVLKGLRALPQVERAEAAGSLRRGMETVGDLDFIVGSSDPGPIMEWFTAMDAVVEVTAKGHTKSSVRFESGLQADLRVVPVREFAFALHHFTGSKDHNVKMRQRALARGLSLSEWGLFPKDAPADERVSVELHSEQALFAELGLDYIPPELREGLDELELAEQRLLPDLITADCLCGALHNHTIASDGGNSLDEMARAAADLGWQFFGIADHSQASFQANGLSADRLLAQVAEIRAGNANGRFPLHVFAGCEVDILKDGSLDFATDILDQLDYAVLSVHSPLTGMSEQEMTDRICRALAYPTSTQKIWGHPTGRLLLRREPYKVDFKQVFAVAAQHNVWIELNATAERLDLDWRLLRQARAAGLKIIINPDAHSTRQLSRLLTGILIARKAGLTAADVVNTADLKTFTQLLNRCPNAS